MPGNASDFSSDSSGGFDMASAVSEIAEGLGFGGDNGSDDSPSDTRDSLDSGADNGAAASLENPPDGEAGDKGTALADESPDAAGDKPAPSPAPAPGAGPDLTQPPKTWRNEAKVGWESLPENVRQEIHKREEDMFSGLEQYKSGAQFGWEVAGLFKPYESIMREAGVGPTQILPGLLEAHATLAMGRPEQKLTMINRLIKDYSIPVPQLLAELTGGALTDVSPYVDPQVKSLQERLESLQSRLDAQSRTEAQQRAAEIHRSIEAFANDPKNVYFAELADDIAALIRGGVTKDLQVAYEKALWANPAVRAKEQARIAAASESERARKAAEAAEKARKASSANVKTTVRNGSPTASKSASLDETLERTLAEIVARDK